MEFKEDKSIRVSRVALHGGLPRPEGSLQMQDYLG